MKNTEFELLCALIDNCRWSERVADLFGPDWDNNGRQLADFIWNLFEDKYGSYGVEFIIDFMMNGNAAYILNGKEYWVETEEELYKALEKYFYSEEKE